MDRAKWERKRIEEVFDLQMGKTPDRKDFSYFGGDNVWVSIRDLSGKYIEESNEKITDKALDDTGIKVVKKGTVIMSFKLTVGKCGIAAKDLYTNEAIMAFNLREGYALDPSFLYYYLQGYHWEGANKAVMGMTLNKATISKQHLLLPSTSEQQTIVAELDKLNELIALKRKQLADLDSLAQSLFYEMFGDPVVNERGWSVTQLGDVCEVSSFKRVLIEDVIDNGIPFIRGTELMALSRCAYGESIDFTLFITPEHYERVKAISGVPKIGDLLIPSINAEGNVWILDTDEPRYYKDGRVLWVHVNEKVYSSQTLKYIMHILLKNTYSEMASGATFAELKLFVLRELKTILPPLPLQQSFAAKVAKIETEKQRVKTSLKDLETLLASRMQYWFDN